MKTKIVLEQKTSMPGGKLEYEVVSLTNRTRPAIGEILTEDDVKKLRIGNELTVEIKSAKKKS